MGSGSLIFEVKSLEIILSDVDISKIEKQPFISSFVVGIGRSEPSDYRFLSQSTGHDAADEMQ